MRHYALGEVEALGLGESDVVVGCGGEGGDVLAEVVVV